MTLFVLGCGSGPSAKVYHVGIVSASATYNPIADGFKARMTELGYVEGKNVVYDFPQATPDQAALKSIAQKFVDAKVDLIVAFPTDALTASIAATQGTQIPILFANVPIEGTTFVKSVREPGGNITGVRLPSPEQAAKRVELLHEILPQARRVYAAYTKNFVGISVVLDEMHKSAAASGLTIVEVPCAGVADLKADLESRAKATDLGIDAIAIMPTSLNAPDSLAVLTKFAADHNLPIAGSPSFPVEKGAIFDITVDALKSGRQVAPMADKVFKGTVTGTIPVASADSVLRFNYKVTQQMGIMVPDGLLKQASQIIR